MAQGQSEKGHSFVLRMRYEGRIAEKIRRSATPQTLKNIFSKSVAKDLKLLKISLPKQSNVRISQAVQEALELTYDVKKTAYVNPLLRLGTCMATFQVSQRLNAEHLLARSSNVTSRRI